MTNFELLETNAPVAPLKIAALDSCKELGKKVNDYIVEWGLHIDRPALIFAVVLFLISFFVQLFSVSYMEKEKRNYRFYALMNLFNFSMVGLFFSPNLFQTYLFSGLFGQTLH